MENPLLSLVVDNDSTAKKALSYNSNLNHYIDLGLIDKIMELSSYTLRFYLLDKTNNY
jgi:hypothetical protein